MRDAEEKGGGEMDSEEMGKERRMGRRGKTNGRDLRIWRG